jgi:regulator of sigma E protease
MSSSTLSGGPSTGKMQEARAWLGAVAFLLGLGLMGWRLPSITEAIAFLSLLIFVHELGHFTLAKLQGMRVEAFSIGFGPPLIKLTRGGTDYQIAAFLLGGYVKLAGEIPESDDQIVNPKPDEFMAKPWWRRALVVAAGPVTNLLFPVLALFLVYASIGRSYPWGPPQVEAVVSPSGAADAGMLPADLIIRVNGQQVTNTRLLANMVDKLSRQTPDRPLTVDLLRAGKPVELKVKTTLHGDKYLMGVQVSPSPPPFSTTVDSAQVLSPAENAGFKKGDVVVSVGGEPLKDGFQFASLFAKAPMDPVEILVTRAGAPLLLKAAKKQPVPDGFADPELLGLIGLDFTPAPADGVTDKRDLLSPGKALQAAFEDTVFSATAIVMGLRDALTGRLKAREALGGPIAIMRMASQQADKGWEPLLQLMCNISLTLGLMNLLPVPVLDGGTFLFCLIEGVRGKPLKLKAQAVLQNIGIALLMTLFAFTMVNDVMRWFHR